MKNPVKWYLQNLPGRTNNQTQIMLNGAVTGAAIFIMVIVPFVVWVS